MELTKRKNECKIKQIRKLVLQMISIFSSEQIHHITEANINFYAAPFVHPRRKMQEHDFIYVLDGEWKIGQDDTEYTLEENSLLILSAGHTHYGISPCSPGTKTMYFHVSCNPGDACLSESVQAKEHIVVPSCMHIGSNRRIKELFAQVVNCKLSGEERKADLYFELLLCSLSDKNIADDNSHIADKLMKIIHANPEKNFGNRELAERINVSVKTAETKFKAVVGQTIHQYILEFKVKQAISYFNLFPEVSIRQTALNLGFYDEYHFSKQFKRITGLSPTRYRERLKGEHNGTEL